MKPEGPGFRIFTPEGEGDAILLPLEGCHQGRAETLLGMLYNRAKTLLGMLYNRAKTLLGMLYNRQVEIYRKTTITSN